MNRYFADMSFQEQIARQLRDFKQGNGMLPLDYLQYHHILPYAKDAGKVGPAGGYADVLKNMPSTYAQKGRSMPIETPYLYYALIAVGVYLYLR